MRVKHFQIMYIFFDILKNKKVIFKYSIGHLIMTIYYSDDVIHCTYHALHVDHHFLFFKGFGEQSDSNNVYNFLCDCIV